MSTRKKTPGKASSHPSKTIRRSSKSSSASKGKDAKISAKIAKPTRAVKKTPLKAGKVAARSSVKPKAKTERSKTSRAAASTKASAKTSKAKTMSAAKLQHAKSTAASAVRAKESAVLVAAKKKSESSKKGQEKLPVTGQPKEIQNITPAVGDNQKTPQPAKAVSAPVAPAGAEPTMMSKPTKPTVTEKPAASEAPEVVAPKAAKTGGNRHGFKTNEYIVYPAHGVGQIVAIEEQEVAGFRLELFVITFVKDKMTLRVPTGKVAGVGMRKLAEPDAVKRALDILLGRARIKRTMWSRRAQEYETKINSGDLVAISEVVRDLYRSEAQPEQSYSERQLYEAALDRMAREVAVVQRLTESEALKAIDAQLQKGQRRGAKAETDIAAPGAGDTDVEEAA
jgi:CarD family transcriptional regulator, regulator of rRNA transcription